MAPETESKTSRKTIEEADLKHVIIAATEGSNQVDVAPAITTLKYCESIFDPTIRIELEFVDSGHSVNTLGSGIVSGLPIVGTETVRVVMEDANLIELDLDLRVNTVNPQMNNEHKSVVALTLTSKEFLQNEDGKRRVNCRFNGKISDHVNRVLTDQRFIGTDKKCEIEPTANVYNCCGTNQKPMAFNRWLQKKGVTTKAENSAGFFLWETSEGYYFKSVDGLMGQEYKKRYIYNNIPDEDGKNIPNIYDGQVIQLKDDCNVDVQQKLQIGSYTTRIVLFDPFNCHYEIIKPTVKPPAPGSTKGKDSKMEPKLAAEELPVDVFSKEFNMDFTRTTYMLWDTGGLPEGNTNTQIEKHQEHNLEPEKLLNQASMRYNQMFTVKRSITIAADFSLHAGDTIKIDIPDLKASKDDEVKDRMISGLYIIYDLSHTFGTLDCYTRLDLVRDSYGKVD